jgi:hypothetical protein
MVGIISSQGFSVSAMTLAASPAGPWEQIHAGPASVLSEYCTGRGIVELGVLFIRCSGVTDAYAVERLATANLGRLHNNTRGICYYDFYFSMCLEIHVLLYRNVIVKLQAGECPLRLETLLHSIKY